MLDMFTPSLQAKTNYVVSSRDYTDDYSHVSSLKIDMTLSGKYLGKYPYFDNNQKYYDYYPLQKHMYQLIEIIRKKNHIDKNKEVILGSGSNGIIQNIIKLFFRKKGNLVTPYLTFNQAEYAANSFGCETRRCFMKSNYDIDLNNICSSIDDNTRLVYICNPNNPTGIYIDPKAIIKIAKNNSKIFFLIDEASIEFSNCPSLLDFNLPKNLMVVRTFSKAYGLANLRIGYLICDKNIKDEYDKYITVNEFSGYSVFTAIKSIDSDLYLDNISAVLREKKYLVKNLEKIGIKIINSSSNIIMTHTSFNSDSTKILNDYGISVVPIIDQNNMLHYRIAIQNKSVNRKFIKVMKYLINKKKLSIIYE